MKLGTTVAIYHKENDYTDYAAIKQHGYDSVDHAWFFDINTRLFQCDDAAFERIVTNEGKLAAETGVEISQVHAPWPFPFPDITEKTVSQRMWEIARTIRGTQLLGARYLVLHPLFPEVEMTKEEYGAFNRAFFEKLLPVAARHEVILCLENMPFGEYSLSTPKEIASFVASFRSPYFKVCLDTGHCPIIGVDAAQAVYDVGRDLLAVLHVHDNDGTGDQHATPGLGIIDWQAFIKALNDIGYEGVFSLEVGTLKQGKTREEKYALSVILANKAKEMLV